VTPCFCFEAHEDAFLDASAVLRFSRHKLSPRNFRDPKDNGQRLISPSHGAKSMKPKK
jgi:hypothetical protein